MARILLINPNSSQATTDMMVRIAQSAAPAGFEIIGATAPHGPPMITTPAALAASIPQVVEIGMAASTDMAGIIISAFGDPGLAELRQKTRLPVLGLAEAAMLAAAAGNRRFGVATTTPALAAAITASVAGLGLDRLYTGIRLTAGDPFATTTDPARLVEALGKAVSACIEGDDAEAVIIGGGPLANAAVALASQFAVPIVAPVLEAIRRVAKLIVTCENSLSGNQE